MSVFRADKTDFLHANELNPTVMFPELEQMSILS